MILSSWKGDNTVQVMLVYVSFFSWTNFYLFGNYIGYIGAIHNTYENTGHFFYLNTFLNVKAFDMNIFNNYKSFYTKKLNSNRYSVSMHTVV